ncbi:MAG TPA: hypothetical protein VFI22_00930, partial [Thermomicrobiales bacterium]|nr:hypothetical protein [Thermomicrobiales bacterium]
MLGATSPAAPQEQAPPPHDSLTGQRLPQPPQFSGSLCGSTQRSTQSVPAQEPQTPFVHLPLQH